LKLEQIIASSCRQKILRALSNAKKTHITNLVRITNSTYNQVKRNLDIMEKEGIVKIQNFGNMKIVELNFSNSKTVKLLKALQTLQTPTVSFELAIANVFETIDGEPWIERSPQSRNMNRIPI